MNNTFVIEFDFPLEYTSIIIRLQAMAEQTDTSSYRVHSFRHPSAPANSAHLLPDQRVICSEQNGYKSWVHLDSEKETALSMAIGRAIDSRNSDA